MDTTFDLLIIGAGPGGYVAAIQAAKLGLRTALVESTAIGGTCLNRGCVPMKAMLEAANRCRMVQSAANFGIHTAPPAIQYEEVCAYRDSAVQQLNQGITRLLHANGVTILPGTGKLLPDRTVQVTDGETSAVYRAKSILLATGSKPTKPAIPGIDSPCVLTTDDLFALHTLPKRLTIIGGGVIGVELAEALSALGCSVAILESQPTLLPTMDSELSRAAKRLLTAHGVEVHTSVSVRHITQSAANITCLFRQGEESYSISADNVLCATGRVPNTDDLFAPGAAPEQTSSAIAVDANFKTSLADVYAIGDLIPNSHLAHAASAQGIFVAEHLAGQAPTVDTEVIPTCVYLTPEIASVGLTSEQAKQAGIPVQTGRFLTSGNVRSILSGSEPGFIKLLAHRETGVILGAHLFCERATDLIGEMTTAIQSGLTAAQLQRTCRAHPTYGEGLCEALEALTGSAIHAMPR